MNAANLREALEAAGIQTLSSQEPEDVVDGQVELNERYHVQVPLTGRSPILVEEADDGMRFTRCRSVKELVSLVLSLSPRTVSGS